MGGFSMVVDEGAASLTLRAQDIAMLKTLEFKNFRGFRSFHASIEGVTALLGPNSSGKTTALHAIRFACDALRLALDSDQPARMANKASEVVVAEGLLIDYGQLLPLSDWRALFTDQKVGEGVELEVTLTFEPQDPLQRVHVCLVCARNDQLKLSVDVTSAQAQAEVDELPKKSKYIKERLGNFLRKHIPIAVFIPPFYGTVRQEEYRTRAMVDRMLGAGDQSHVVRNLVVGLEPTQLDRLNAFLKEAIGARIATRTSVDQVESVTQLTVTFQDDNGALELSAAGAGLVNLIALYTALSRWRHVSGNQRVLFLLDEPEAHLHPRLQADMSERLAQLVTQEFGAQLILATHSVDILNRLSTTGALLVRCDRRAEPSAVTLDGDAALFDDLATWVDLTPYTAINFLASRRVVFCEGVDEVALIPHLARLYCRNDPSKESNFRRWSLLPLHGASNAPISSLLGRLLKNDVVRARARDAIFHIELVLDRDHARTPGMEVKENDNIREIITVWPLHSLESLMLEPRILSIWVRAFAEMDIPSLSILVEQAFDVANKDSSLNDAAEAQLVAKMIGSDLNDGKGNPLKGEQKTVHAVRQAKQLVKMEPWVWQRGKDRGKVILGEIRKELPKSARKQFPTDVIRLVEKTDLNRIGNPIDAIPQELREILARLTAP